MWSLFRRKPSESSFPKPEWPPIQSLDSIDLTGQRHDGGLDLIIVASQPIDDSPQTLDSIRRKVQTYLKTIELEEFQAEMGNPPRDKITIIIASDHPIHDSAHAVISQCRATAAMQGVTLEIRTLTDSKLIPSPTKGGNEVEQSILPATDSDRIQISRHVARLVEMLQSRYLNVDLRRTKDDLLLLQRLHDDGVLHVCRQDELDCIGFVFGEILSNTTALRWITVEWQAERLLALQYPNTAVIVFPTAIIAKRIDRAEKIDFHSLYRSTVNQIDQMQRDPNYRR